MRDPVDVAADDLFFQGTGVLTLVAGIGVALAVLGGRRPSPAADRRPD